MRLLLINPRFQESFWSFKWATEKILPDKRTTNPPLGLATLAALCPKHWEVSIVDENIETIPLNPRADIIGICGMGVQYERQKELLTFYRKKGFFVVAGGSYASLCPEKYQSIADTVISGEAEYIWKEFCDDFEKGKHKKLYQESGEVNLSDSPTPRFDLLDLDKYRAVSLQFSRGCPYRCEFCDIIIMFGRKPRTKSLEQVGKELDLLRRLNATSTFFVDDNFIGNKKQAKSLLSFLRDYQQKHNYWFNFGTESSLNMAQDNELMTLFREANFKWVFVGIESPDTESLKETKKFQNTREDILTSIRKIYSYGIEIYGGFIVGFDNDTTAVFDKQFNFIQASGIQSAMIGLLTAIPKTPLYERLEKEGRLVPWEKGADNTKLETNVIPRQMTYDEMINGYRDLYNRLLTYRNVAGRIKNKTRYLKNPVWKYNSISGNNLNLLKNFFVQSFRKGKTSWLLNFFRSLPFTNPKVIPLVLQDWVIALSMRDYVDRHFIREFEEKNRIVAHYLEKIRKAFRRYLSQGNLEVSLTQMKNTASNLTIKFNGVLEKDFFRKGERYLSGVLKKTAASITLNIGEIHTAQLKNLNRMLKKLSRYGDRIYISIPEDLRNLVNIDSSVFNLVLVSDQEHFV
ncbi:MAG: radical SAM protein [Calditrichia bacterium]